MSPKDLLDSTELELIERELYALSEAEQAAQQRSLALPVGYEKSQAFAEHWNAAAALSAMSRRRERLLPRQGCHINPDVPLEPKRRPIGFTADPDR